MPKITALIVAGVFALLSACNTVGGLGQDVQAGGQAISSTAQEVEQDI